MVCLGSYKISSMILILKLFSELNIKRIHTDIKFLLFLLLLVIFFFWSHRVICLTLVLK